MNLKATILLLLFALVCAAPCAAQDKKKRESPARPDFSGTWVLDLKKSGYGDAHSPRAVTLPTTLVITHGGPEVRVTRKFSGAYGAERGGEIVYYTDDRGEKNTLVGSDRVSLSGEVESHTKWKGARLVIRGREYLVTFGDTNSFDFTERWELSPDGTTLTQTKEYDMLGEPGGPARVPRREGDTAVITPVDSKKVYNRAP
jgi:hypothetical protein